MNYKQIYKLNERQFNKVLNKEGYKVKDYFTSKEYTVIFRKEQRSKTPNSFLRIYYPQSYPFSVGTIITVKNEPYILYSQDAIESDIYYTSTLIKCDVVYPVGSEQLPCVLMQDTWGVSKGTVNIVSGTVILYTQTNQFSNNISVNDGYYNFGNYYEVGNKFSNKGITYIYMEQKPKPVDNYVLTYNGRTNFDTSEQSYQMDFIVTNNGVVVEPQPTLTYHSSDTSVATITNTGLLMILNTGNTTITCTDSEHNLTKTLEVVVTAVVDPHTYNITYNGINTTVRINGSGKILTIHSFDEGVEDTTTYLANKTLTWDLTCDAYTQAGRDLNNYALWEQQTDFNSIRLKLIDAPSAGELFYANCYADGVKIAQLEMEIVW